MHFALLDGVRVEPEKGLDGVICPICRQPVRARCGEVRVKHWAHKSVIDCDLWKESETTWHREWKNHFGDLQEQMHEKDGVRHMADVKTSDGTIVEFRHSTIDTEGIRTREAFFGETMFWVADCMAESKKLRFYDNLSSARKLDFCADETEVWSISDPERVFPRRWVESRRFVFFDFGEPLLWCLFPRNEKARWGVFIHVSKNAFVAMVKNGYAKFREECVSIWRQVDDLRRKAQIQDHVCFKPRSDLRQLRHVGKNTSPTGADVIWPETFNRAVSLALTVDVLQSWLIARGQLNEVLTGSHINGEADVAGCCAIHCSAYFDPLQLYWSRRRMEGEVGSEIMGEVPTLNELKESAGHFMGVSEYYVEELPSNQVKIHLRNFKRLACSLKSQQSSECIWRMDDALRSQFELTQQRER